jgi:hypothetical protein
VVDGSVGAGVLDVDTLVGVGTCGVTHTTCVSGNRQRGRGWRTKKYG